MELSKLSPTLRAALAAEIEKMPPDTDPEKAIYTAMKGVAARIFAGETGLIDLSNSGDSFALTLAELA